MTAGDWRQNGCAAPALVAHGGSGGRTLPNVQDYRRLLAWEKAHALALAVRQATHRFRRSDYAALRMQAIRAAESIPSNIVEGCYAASRKDFARFLDISIKSTGELEYRLQLAHEAFGCPILRQPWPAYRVSTSAVATSPTICNDAGEILSIVSVGLWWCA